MTDAVRSSKPRVGFVGLGMMGAPMAARIAEAGYPLSVFDRSVEVMAHFGSRPGCHPCASAADTAREAEFLVTMLPGSPAVAETLRGGVFDALPEGACIVDMSSSEPLVTRTLADEAASRGLVLIDAPVSGGVKKARDGSLAIMAGGSPADVARCEPLLKCMGASVFHTGAVGSGHAMKALNNFVSAAGLVAAVEALHIGASFGLDPRTITRVLNASTGRNNSTENKFPQYILPRTFNSGFSIGLMVKDLRIALEVARASGMPAPLSEACLDVWAQAERALGPQADHTAVVQFWEELAGSRIGAKPQLE